MKWQALSLRREKKEKKKLGLTFVRRTPKDPKKRLDQNTLELPESWGVLGKCKKESARIWTAQGSMLIDTRNEDRHVPSVAHDSEKS